MQARLRALERSLAPPVTVEGWCTREGEPCQPPEAVRLRVEEEASRGPGEASWRCGVWVPEDALVLLLGDEEGHMEIVELQP